MTTTLDDSTPTGEAQLRRLTRTDDGRWLGGVASGLGSYFDVNPLVYRIVFAALTFAGGMGILLYIAAWLVIPAEGSADSIAVEGLRRHRDRPWLLLGVGLLLLAAVTLGVGADIWDDGGDLWLAAVLAGTALLWWHFGGARDTAPDTVDAAASPGAPRPPARPSLVAPALGALLALAGVLGLLAAVDVWTVAADQALAAAVAVVGVTIAVGAMTGRRVGALIPVGLVLLAAFGIAATTPTSVSTGVGERLERPLDAAALQRSYEFGLGEFRLDLSSVALAEGETRVDVSLGVGDLLVTVPDDVALEIDANAGIGEVIVLGDADEGVGADRSATLPGSSTDAPVLVLEADVGFGQVEVRRG